jgi:hypothetical protein
LLGGTIYQAEDRVENNPKLEIIPTKELQFDLTSKSGALNDIFISSLFKTAN